MTSRLGTVGLLHRHRAHVRPLSLAVAGLTFLVTAALVAGPALLTATVEGELRQTQRDGTPTARHLVATTVTTPDDGPSTQTGAHGLDATLDPLVGAFEDRLEDVRRSFPEPIRSSSDEARWSLRTGSLQLSENDPRTVPPGGTVILSLLLDPHAREHVRVTEGRWPTGAPDERDEQVGEPHRPVEIALSEQSAAKVGWRVGEVRSGHVLTGLFRARAAGADYWALNPSVLGPAVVDDGNNPPGLTVTAFANPRRIGLSAAIRQGFGVQIWWRLDLSGVPGSELGAVVAGLRKVTSTTYDETPDTRFVITSTGLPALEQAQDRVDAVRAVTVLTGIGPAAAALLVLALGLRVFSTRRRAAVGLLASRGLSRRRLRLLMGAEGLLLGVPAAVLGTLLVVWRSGAPPSSTALLLAALVGLTPGVLLAATPIEAAIRPVRADRGSRGGRSRRRHGWLLEGALLVLAGASTYLLLASGVQGSARSGGGIDVLAVAAPLLVSAAACVVVLRLYPLPLHAVARRLRRSTSTVGFLGALRSLRDPTAGIAPVLAVLVGVSVVTFSSVLLTTLGTGTEEAALSSVGAELRVDGPVVSDAALQRVRAVDGVRDAARLGQSGPLTVTVEGRSSQVVEVLRTDLAALVRVQRGVPGALVVPRPDGGVVTSPGLSDAGDRVRFGNDLASPRVPVLGTSRSAAGVSTQDEWVVVDATSGDLGTFAPRSVLVSLAPGADSARVARDLASATGGNGTVTSAAETTTERADDAAAVGLRRFLVGAVGVVGLAAAAAVVLSLLLGAPTRTRMLAILRVLGVPRRRRAWLAAWEQAPAAVVALLVGGGLGIGLAAAVQRVVDLAPFTGGATQPALDVDPVLLVALLGGFVVMVVAVSGLGLWTAYRASTSAAVRLDEE